MCKLFEENVLTVQEHRNNTIKNDNIHYEIESRINSENTCHHKVKILYSS